MSAKAFLKRSSEPTREEIRDAISGNICRCTGYENAVEAILDTAMETSCAPTSYLGAHSRTGGFHAQTVAFNCRFTFEKLGQTQKKGAKRTDGALIVTGRADFTGDISLPGMLFGKVLRSPYPHARIKKINTEKAKKLEGVKGVVTGKGIDYRRFSFIDTPVFPADQTTLAVDKVKFVGEGVAPLLPP